MSQQVLVDAELLERLANHAERLGDGDAWPAPDEVEGIDCDVSFARLALTHPQPSNSAGEVLAKEVHAAWRDGMLIQQRKVASERMKWETLSEDDHQLDLYIAARLFYACTGKALDLPSPALAAQPPMPERGEVTS